MGPEDDGTISPEVMELYARYYPKSFLTIYQQELLSLHFRADLAEAEKVLAYCAGNGILWNRCLKMVQIYQSGDYLPRIRNGERETASQRNDRLLSERYGRRAAPGDSGPDNPQPPRLLGGPTGRH